MDENYVVCETDTAVVLHLQRKPFRATNYLGIGEAAVQQIGELLEICRMATNLDPTTYRADGNVSLRNAAAVILWARARITYAKIAEQESESPE